MDYKNYEPVFTSLDLLNQANKLSEQAIGEITKRLRCSPRQCLEALEYEDKGYIHVFDHEGNISQDGYVMAVTLVEGKPSLLVRDDGYEEEYTFEQLLMDAPYDVLYFMDMVNFPASADPNFAGENEDGE